MNTFCALCLLLCLPVVSTMTVPPTANPVSQANLNAPTSPNQQPYTNPTSNMPTPTTANQLTQQSYYDAMQYGGNMQTQNPYPTPNDYNVPRQQYQYQQQYNPYQQQYNPYQQYNSFPNYNPYPQNYYQRTYSPYGNQQRNMGMDPATYFMLEGGNDFMANMYGMRRWGLPINALDINTEMMLLSDMFNPNRGRSAPGAYRGGSSPMGQNQGVYNYAMMQAFQ